MSASLAAAPHCDEGSKPEVRALERFPARAVPGEHLLGGYLYLECRLERVVEDLGPNLLIIGKVVGALLDPAYERNYDVDDQDLLRAHPLLAYLAPGRWAMLGDTLAFPYPAGFCR